MQITRTTWINCGVRYIDSLFSLLSKWWKSHQRNFSWVHRDDSFLQCKQTSLCEILWEEANQKWASDGLESYTTFVAPCMVPLLSSSFAISACLTCFVSVWCCTAEWNCLSVYFMTLVCCWKYVIQIYFCKKDMSCEDQIISTPVVGSETYQDIVKIMGTFDTKFYPPVEYVIRKLFDNFYLPNQLCARRPNW